MSNLLLNFDAFKAVSKSMLPEQKPKVLFRFPGPCGLHDLSNGTLKTLAPANLPNVFLFKDRFNFVSPGIETFGVFSILDTEYFEVLCLDDEALMDLKYDPSDMERIFLGTNKIVEEREQFLWTPARIYNLKTQWSQVSPKSLTDLIVDSDYEDERKQAFDHVHQYMEEVAIVEKAFGVLKTPWYLTSSSERSARLAQAGIKSRWTK